MYIMVDVAFFSASSLISKDMLSTAAGNDSFNMISLVYPPLPKIQLGFG